MDNSELEKQIKAILLRHEGKERAITGRELAYLVRHRDDRQVRIVIRRLIADGLSIASSTERPGGYYIAITRQEAEEYIAVMRSRLIQDALRIRDFKRNAKRYLEPVEQGRLC